MAIRYEKIEKTKNSKSFFGYKTKENQQNLKSIRHNTREYERAKMYVERR